MDFIEAREKRREILNILRQQQSDDATCVNQIKAVAIQGKQALLRVLAEWLTSIRPEHPVTTSTRTAFSTITVRLSVEDWLKTQLDCDSAEAQFQRAVALERKAEADYKAVAPWGVLSTVFSDDAQKKQIEPLKVHRDAAERVRAKASVALETARQQLAVNCERILRDAASPEQLQRICDEPELSPLLAPIIQQTAESARALWVTHSGKHEPTSERMGTAIRDLQIYYKGVSGTSMAVLSKQGGL
jgi:uncharacterized protein (DUF2267 family)